LILCLALLYACDETSSGAGSGSNGSNGSSASSATSASGGNGTGGTGGNGNGGAPNGGSGPGVGSSLRFYGNGMNDIDRVKISIDQPHVPADIGAGDFTIELWLKAMPGDNQQSG
jgi:hypothetical protein